MKATGNYFYNTLYMKPALWSSNLDNFYLQQTYNLTAEKGLEARLEAMAEDLELPLLEVAKEYLESGDVIFYAVGLAHLLAEDGLVTTLRKAGYTVEQVSYHQP